MIESIHISNYALIDRVDLRFAEGFNAVTGETGAGKSIMLGALSLLLGGRADTRAVADPQHKSVIEAAFTRVGHNDMLRAACEAHDIDWDPERCILRREVAASGSGRSRAFVNDTPVPLAVLREIAILLVDIHSQHQNQLLTQPSFQLHVLDRLAGNDERLNRYSKLWAAYRQALTRLKRAQVQLERSRREEEFLRFQVARFDELNLQPGEQETLERDRDLLENRQQVHEALSDIVAALSDDDSGAIDRSRMAATRLEGIANMLNPEDAIDRRLESAIAELEDIAATIDSLRADLDTGGGDLEAINNRLSEIYDLQRRHQVDSDEALLAIADSLRERLDSIDNADSHIGDLKKEARRMRDLARELAAEISAARHQAAASLAEKWRATAAPLAMQNLAVEIAVTDTDLGPQGADDVDFRFAFNKNQTPMSISGIASGGEVSRLMLTLKAILARHVNLPSIIFDEIDTGVSGDVASRMGLMMASMASGSDLDQVIAITHLPQVAARAVAHFKVYKEDDDTATRTRIMALDTDRRIDELATMLSGNPADPAARANALSLMQNQ